MPIYTCKRCKNQYYTKQELKIHQSAKNKCEKRKISPKVLLKCECECGKILSTPYTLKQHKEACIARKKIINAQTLNAKDIHTKNGNNILVAHNENGTINANTINITNNIIISKILLDDYRSHFGIFHLPIEQQEELLDMNNNPHLTLFKLNHFDPSRPSYHNLYYNPDNHPNVWVYNTCRWILCKMSSLINEVLKIQKKEFEYFLDKVHCRIDIKIETYIRNYIDLSDVSNISSKMGKKEIIYLHNEMQMALIENSPKIFITYSRTKNNSLYGYDKLALENNNPTNSDGSSDSNKIKSSSHSSTDSDLSSDTRRIKLAIKNNRKKTSSDSYPESSSESDDHSPLVKKSLLKKPLSKKKSTKASSSEKSLGSDFSISSLSDDLKCTSKKNTKISTKKSNHIDADSDISVDSLSDDSI
jgi:hypothetical protein